MHAMSLLEKWLQGNAVIGHQARVAALVRVVGALLNGGKLALTHLGRHRAGRAFVKHHIKAVDRLLGNRHLQPRTRRCLSRPWRGRGAGKGRASGDSRRLGRQCARAQTAHPQGGGAGEGTSDFGLRRSASDALVQQGPDSPAIPASTAIHPARGLSPNRRHRRGIPRSMVSRCRSAWMGLGREDSKSHQILATGNGTLVLHPLAVPTRYRAGTSRRLAMSVAPAPVLGPAVPGARVARSPGPTSQAPNPSNEVSPDAPNSVAARHLAASSSRGPALASGASTPSACRSRRPFATSRTTDSDSHCATRARSAPNVSKPCCSSPRSPR